MERHPNGNRRQSQDLIDNSKLLRKRAKKLVARSSELVTRTHHKWHMLAALGRVCAICETTQASGEFDDRVPCKRTAVS